QLSDLADVCVAAALRVAERETLARYGLTTSPGSFAVVGMGKLGSRELTYHSDLDLIFVYLPAAQLAEGVAVHEYFTRLAQRILTTLQVPTREGIAYHIDTRLRPSGNKGPLVSALDSFGDYHERSAQLWERQALIKARVLSGAVALREQLEAVIARFVYGRGLAADEVAEIARMRARIAQERGAADGDAIALKAGRGGLMDVESLVRMPRLRY